MSNELKVLDNSQSAIVPAQEGGFGIDYSNPLFRLQPATININQPTTQAEGAIKGKLRITETGEQFDEMFVTLLAMPQKQRSWYDGKPGQLNRQPENLMCFSRDAIRPDAKAKIPQALTCAGCPKGSWDAYRAEKEAGRIPDKSLIPPCDEYFYALFIDTVFKMPLQMFIRSKSKAAFDQGMKNVARILLMEKARGKNPNIFDVRFRLGTKAEKNGATTTYSLTVSDVKAITPEERKEFGEVYQAYTAQKSQPAAQQEDEKTNATNQEIDAAVGGEYVDAIEV